MYKKLKTTHVQNEFEIQKEIYNKLIECTTNIVVPYSCCYQETGNTCSYQMQRIFPLDDNTNKFYVTNMAEPDIKSTFSHSKTAYQIGYNVLAKEYGINTLELAYNIGLLYSYLHYVLRMDGYDCELIYGKMGSVLQFILIDYDKVQKIRFEKGFTSYRKYDENTIVEKSLDTPSRFANYLFGSLVSMCLLPVDAIHKNEFIRGYTRYMSNETSEFSKEVQTSLLKIMNDYFV